MSAVLDACRDRGELTQAFIDKVDGPANIEAVQRARVAQLADLQGASPLTESGQLRELWRRHGLDVDNADYLLSRKLVERFIAPLGGGAVGGGSAAFLHNVPEQGSFVMNPEQFDLNTERNDVPQEVKAFTGLGGSRIDQRISNVGVLANIRLIFKGQLVVGASGTCTALYGWPWDLAKRITLNANGQTSLIQCEGKDLRARRQRIFRNPRDTVSVAPATNTTTIDPSPGVIAPGTYSVVLVYDLPIVHDDETLTGALFAQSDQTYLNWTVEPAASSDLFTLASGSTATVTGNFYPTLTFFDIPYVETQQGRMVVLPDMRWLHGFLAQNAPFANTGDVKSPLIRTAGQLICLYWYIDNGGAAQIAISALDEVRWNYGANRTPRVFSPPEQLLEKINRDYNGPIAPNYGVLDFEGDNPRRDIVLPKGLSELMIINKVAAGTTVNANARVHFVEETLFAGR